jgi:D-alanyl-D-alanine carboxypeptidase
MRLLLAGALALTACLATLAALVTPATAADRDARQPPGLEKGMDALVAAGVPGVVVLVRDGDQTVTLARGYGNLARKTPLRPGDQFRIGSITKSYVATVVLQLVGEGKLSLDDSVERWLPGLVSNGENITVRQLLGHTSGLYDYVADPRVVKPYIAGNFSFRWTPRALIKLAQTHKPLFAPGTGVAYSSTGYVLLGLIVKAATGNPIGSELSRRIFAPLGLSATSFATTGRIAGPHAHGYLYVPKRPLQDVTAISPSYYWAAGNIVSDAGDIARFYQALLGGQLLSPDLLNTMETTAADRRGNQLGLGLFMGQSSCGEFWGHDGAVPGYDSIALNSKDGTKQVVVLANSVSFSDTVGSPRAQRALERLVDTAYCG